MGLLFIVHIVLGGRFGNDSLDQEDDEDELDGKSGSRTPTQAVMEALRYLVSYGGDGASKSRRLTRLNGLTRLWETDSSESKQKASSDHEIMQAELKLNVMLW